VVGSKRHCDAIHKTRTQCLGKMVMILVSTWDGIAGLSRFRSTVGGVKSQQDAINSCSCDAGLKLLSTTNSADHDAMPMMTQSKR
jgi:hypothetical protein